MASNSSVAEGVSPSPSSSSGRGSVLRATTSRFTRSSSLSILFRTPSSNIVILTPGPAMKGPALCRGAHPGSPRSALGRASLPSAQAVQRTLAPGMCFIEARPLTGELLIPDFDSHDPNTSAPDPGRKLGKSPGARAGPRLGADGTRFEGALHGGLKK